MLLAIAAAIGDAAGLEQVSRSWPWPRPLTVSLSMPRPSSPPALGPLVMARRPPRHSAAEPHTRSPVAPYLCVQMLVRDLLSMWSCNDP